MVVHTVYSDQNLRWYGKLDNCHLLFMTVNCLFAEIARRYLFNDYEHTRAIFTRAPKTPTWTDTCAVTDIADSSICTGTGITDIFQSFCRNDLYHITVVISFLSISV